MPLFRRHLYDLVIVAARYGVDGRVEWVRAFERRGPTWSDRRMIPRAELIERIRNGERTVTGERIQYEAGTFKTWEKVHVEEREGIEVLVAGPPNGSKDALQFVPGL